MKRPILIGIAGGTGSGKTTVAREITAHISSENIVLIEQDSYYKAQHELTFEERTRTNYDHPDAFDTELLIEHLYRLIDRRGIVKPVYNFAEHTRAEEVVAVEPRDVIILEGILILEDRRLRELMDIKIYVDTDADVRFVRRLLRDIQQRGRTVESVVDQYMSVVRPMHLRFIEPTKRYADVIIPEGGQNQVAIDLMVSKVRSILGD